MWFAKKGAKSEQAAIMRDKADARDINHLRRHSQPKFGL